MDGRNFDALTRTLASGSNRRRVLKGLVGLVLGGAATASVADAGDAACSGFGRGCATPTDCCTGFACTGGVCKCPVGQVKCTAAGSITCVPACPAGQYLGSSCRCLCLASGRPPVDGRCGCRAGETDCGDGACRDLSTDPANCGACGAACAAPRDGTCENQPICLAGTCTYTPLPAGTTCRAVAGICDLAETCTGSSLDCPIDTFQSPTVECRPATCSDGVETLAATCHSDGPNCPDPVTRSCAPYLCNPAGTACLTGCAVDDDCQAGHHCDDGQCLPDEGLGEACDEDGDCASGFCVGGICCNERCGGECVQCTAATGGICTPASSQSCGASGGQVCCNGTCCGDGEDCVGTTCQATCLPVQSTCNPALGGAECCQDEPTFCHETVCGASQCCHPAGGFCNGDACDCCEDMICDGLPFGSCCHSTGTSCTLLPGGGNSCCFGDRCVSRGPLGIQVCESCVGDYTSPGSCDSNGDCCSGYCHPGTGFCCRTQGTPCSEIGTLGGECCLQHGLTCSGENGSCIPCRTLGETCEGTGIESTCCLGSHCDNGRCVQDFCGGLGAPCQHDSVCCAEFAFRCEVDLGVCVQGCLSEGMACGALNIACCEGMACDPPNPTGVCVRL